MTGSTWLIQFFCWLFEHMVASWQASLFESYDLYVNQCCNQVDDNVRLEDDWVPMDEQLDASELEEVLRTKEAHSRAVVLESVSIGYI